MLKLHRRILHHGDIIPFTPVTPNFGIAAFRVCLQFRRGILRFVYIWPCQQPDAREHFIFKTQGSKGIYVQSWTHKGVPEPWTSEVVWCKEHGGPGLYVCAPREAKAFHLEDLSVTQFIFTNELK